MREIAIGDIHGCYNELRQLLKTIGPLANEDTLVFLGDYIDRGPDSEKVFECIKKLKESDRIKLLIGNHEHMMFEFFEIDPSIDFGDEKGMWNWFGGRTAKSFGSIEATRDAALWLFENTQLQYETENAIYVHAGLIPDSETPIDKMLWMSGTSLNEYPTQPKRLIVGHTTVHALTTAGILPEVVPAPFINHEKNYVMVDNGCVYGYGPLCAYDCVNDTAYYSDGKIVSISAR